MNAQRRKEIKAALAMIETARAILETCRDQEQDYRDNMPEAIGEGDKGQKADAAIENLSDVIDQIEAFDLDDATA